MAGKGNPYHRKSGKDGGQFVKQQDVGVANATDNPTQGRPGAKKQKPIAKRPKALPIEKEIVVGETADKTTENDMPKLSLKKPESFRRASDTTKDKAAPRRGETFKRASDQGHSTMQEGEVREIGGNKWKMVNGRLQSAEEGGFKPKKDDRVIHMQSGELRPMEKQNKLNAMVQNEDQKRMEFIEKQRAERKRNAAEKRAQDKEPEISTQRWKNRAALASQQRYPIKVTHELGIPEKDRSFNPYWKKVNGENVPVGIEEAKERENLVAKYQAEYASTKDWRIQSRAEQAIISIKNGTGALGPDAKKAAEIAGTNYGFLSEEGVKRVLANPEGYNEGIRKAGEAARKAAGIGEKDLSIKSERQRDQGINHWERHKESYMVNGKFDAKKLEKDLKSMGLTDETALNKIIGHAAANAWEEPKEVREDLPGFPKKKSSRSRKNNPFGWGG